MAFDHGAPGERLRQQGAGVLIDPAGYRQTTVAVCRVPAPPRPVAKVTEQRSAYLRELREAGVNLRIAKTLVAAGFSSVAAVRAASDAQILRVHGIGPATLRRLRSCCGPSA